MTEPSFTPNADFFDPVIELYKQDVDRSLLREHLKLTPAERAEKFARFLTDLDELRNAGCKLRSQQEGQ